MDPTLLLRIDNSGRSVIWTFGQSSQPRFCTIIYDISNERAYLSLSFDMNDTFLLFYGSG